MQIKKKSLPDIKTLVSRTSSLQWHLSTLFMKQNLVKPQKWPQKFSAFWKKRSWIFLYWLSKTGVVYFVQWKNLHIWLLLILSTLN